jgi:hypothetical protein
MGDKGIDIRQGRTLRKFLASKSIRAARWYDLSVQIYQGDYATLHKDLGSGFVFSKANPLGIKCAIAFVYTHSEASFVNALGKDIGFDGIIALSEHDGIKELLNGFFEYAASYRPNELIWASDTNKTSQFILDLCLPPDKADEMCVGLEDAFNRRWLPRYGTGGAKFIFITQALATVVAHQNGRLHKLFALLLGLPFLKKLSTWLWG